MFSKTRFYFDFNKNNKQKCRQIQNNYQKFVKTVKNQLCERRLQFTLWKRIFWFWLISSGFHMDQRFDKKIREIEFYLTQKFMKMNPIFCFRNSFTHMLSKNSVKSIPKLLDQSILRFHEFFFQVKITFGMNFSKKCKQTLLYEERAFDMIGDPDRNQNIYQINIFCHINSFCQIKIFHEIDLFCLIEIICQINIFCHIYIFRQIEIIHEIYIFVKSKISVNFIESQSVKTFVKLKFSSNRGYR